MSRRLPWHRTGLLPLLILGLLTVVACQRTPADAAAEGRPFPSLQARVGDAPPAPWRLPAGRLRLVNVWAVWCPPCRKEMPVLQRLAGQLADEGIVVTTLVVEEDVWLVDEFVRRHRLSLPVAMLDRQTAERRLGVFDYPLTLLVDAEGTVLMRLRGALDWAHPDVVAMLRELAAGGAIAGERRAAVLAAARSSFLRQALRAREAGS